MRIACLYIVVSYDSAINIKLYIQLITGIIIMCLSVKIE